MSLDGRPNSLQLNVVGTLIGNNDVFIINPTANEYQGQWIPSGYTPGTLTSSTVLDYLTRAIPVAFSKIGTIGTTTYRNLIAIGRNSIPALGNSPPTTFIPSYRGGWTAVWPDSSNGYAVALPNTAASDEYFSNGFIATIARQAYYEFYSGSGDSQNSYFVKSIILDYAWKKNRNQLIGGLVNTRSFLKSSYGGINDLSSAGVSSVNSDFRNFGEDLIRTGRAIDLASIPDFGLPSMLLKTLNSYGAITQALGLLLVLSGLSGTEIKGIAGGTIVSTTLQEKKIYNAFVGTVGDDFNAIKTILNITTPNLVSLADLLNPLKLLPNSYSTLYAPKYQDPYTNEGLSKMLVPIYSGTGVNPNVGDNTLVGILPDDIARAATAFGQSMMQINNITQMQIERASQVIQNLQTVSGSEIEDTTSVANSLAIANNTLGMVALGGGSNGSYRMADFLGAMSGVTYNLNYDLIQSTLIQNNNLFTTLANTYREIYELVDGPGPYTQLQDLINLANTQIENIMSSNVGLANRLNSLWDMIGTNLTVEQRAITTANPTQEGIVLASTSIDDYQSFIQAIEEYAADNGIWEIKNILLAIANNDNIGGQSITGALTTAQNAMLLALTGAPLNDSVSTAVDPQQASASVVCGPDGRISQINITNGGGGYNEQSCACCMPDVAISGGLTKAVAVVDMDSGVVTGIEITSGAEVVYPVCPTITIAPPAVPAPLGSAGPGSFAGSNFTDLVPTNLQS